MLNIVSLPTFRQERAQVDDLTVHGEYDQTGRFTVKKVRLKDQETEPTDRFWMSLCSKFGIGLPVFNYFTHKEVFDRIKTKSKDANIKITIQDTPAPHQRTLDKWTPQLLGIASNKTGALQGHELIDVLNNLNNASNVDYLPGRIVSTHSLKRPFVWGIGKDDHECFLYLDTPIDGYGKPKLYLSMMRLRCSNMLVAACKPFSSGVILGKVGAPGTLQRAVESFSNEQGFIGLKERLLSAQKSWASMYECLQLSTIISKFNILDIRPDFIATIPAAAEKPHEVKNRQLRKLYHLTGDMREIYGVAQLDVLSAKQQRMIPSKATVYDLICLATELATYQLTPQAAEKMFKFVGNLVGTDIYDLENSCNEFKEFSDFIDENNKIRKECA